MRLRTLLAILLSFLLAFTAGSIGWLGYSNSRSEIKRSTREEFALANALAMHHVVDFLDDPANRLLSELTLRARRGMLNLHDDQVLGTDLAERLRVNPTLAWIDYSDAATGHFVGARRAQNGDITLNISSPSQGPPHEVVVHADGQTTPYVHGPLSEYDPRKRDWFRQAMAASDTVWSPPYTFTEGVEGITASKAWRPTDGAAPAGVFAVDFFLKDLQDLLESLTGKDRRFTAILGPDGTLIASSRAPDAPALVAALAGWVKANPQFKDINGKSTSHLIHLDVGTTTYLVALVRVSAPSGLKCIVAGMVPRDTLFQHADQTGSYMLEVAAGALASSILVGFFMAYRISEPLRFLGDDMARVGHFELARGQRLHSMVREVNQLHDAADRMKSGLRSFIKYVPDELVRRVLASGREAALGGEIRRLTIFLSDIEGFTTYSESTTPDKLVHELADYLGILTRQVQGHSGTIDKFIGDGLLAFFNAPDDVSEHERLACRATLTALGELAEWRREKGGNAFRTRVGLHAGEVLVGNLGTAERLAYTVLGDAVNVTSRLEGLNKIYGTQVLASGEVRRQAGEEFEWRHLDRAAVAGRRGGMEIYELLGKQGEVDGERLRQRDVYEKALALYFARDFREACALFAELAGDGLSDKAAVLMLARCDDFSARSLPADWDGVFAHAVK